MNSLRNEGLVETRPGVGWYVRKPPDVVRLLRRPEPGRRVDGSAWLGCGAAQVVTFVRFDVAPALIAAELQIGKGAEIVVRERTMFDGGVVVALASSYFPRSLSRGTVIEAEDTGPGRRRTPSGPAVPIRRRTHGRRHPLVSRHEHHNAAGYLEQPATGHAITDTLYPY